MVMASGRWLGVRLDLVAALLIGTVAMAAVLTSQDPGNYIYILKQLFDKSGVNIDCPVSYGRTSAEGKLTSDQAFFFFGGVRKHSNARVGGLEGGEKRTPDTITARVVCRQSRIWTFV